MSGASVAVIGGGVIGASVAYHLARRGWRDMVVLDRGPAAGGGSTGRATGGFRAQYATAVNVRLSLLAREKLRCFEAETGVDPGYAECGYLWLAGAAEELAELERAQRIQHAEGLTEAVLLGLDDIAAVNPAVHPSGVVGAAYCPSDGFIKPLAILEGYLRAASRLGVEMRWDVEAVGLRRRPDGSIAAVETTRGPIEVEAVVDAAGAWAATVAAWAGVRLPVVPLRRQAATSTPCDLLPASMPMTIWTGDGFHVRVRDGRVLLLQPTPGVPDAPFDTRVDSEWVDMVERAAHARVPVLRRATIDRAACWAGLYEISPDKHAILGAAPECPNLFFANGSSGHGVMHAPGLGQLLAEIISDGKASSMDATPLRYGRFAEGAVLATSGV
ncbi:MAG TPA: FAD-dependent oxidoreductase, partial [Gemmatimonadales bacterium]|nr:FAD-dependent oxidoreductase [Gemmatimonadales bacterium]